MSTFYELAYTWELRAVFWHQETERRTLELEAWEPFAVTESDDGATVWFRRLSGPPAQVQRDDFGRPTYAAAPSPEKPS